MSSIKKQIVIKVSEKTRVRRFRVRRDVFSRSFNYNLDFKRLDFKKEPSYYRIGQDDTGLHVVQPYAEILSQVCVLKNAKLAHQSALRLLKCFEDFQLENDFIGMDMTRKYLQFGILKLIKKINPLSLSSLEPFEEHSERMSVELLEDQKPQSYIEALLSFKRSLKTILEDDSYLEARAQWKDLLG